MWPSGAPRGDRPPPSRRGVIAVLVLVLAVGTIAGAAGSELAPAGPADARQDDPEEPPDPSENESEGTAEADNGTTADGTEDDDQVDPGEQTDPSGPTEPVVPLEPEERAPIPGERREDGSPIPAFGPDENLTVSLADNHTIPADGVATATLEVRNTDDDEVTDIVVELRSMDPSVFFGSPAEPLATRTRYVGNLSAGETTAVGVDIGAADVEPGSYPVLATLQYEMGDGDATAVAGGPRPLSVEVREGLEFELATTNDSVPVDASATYEVTVRNDGEETATDVVATIETAPPVSSGPAAAAVGTLEPGESGSARFPIETDEDAVETTGSASVSLTYTTESGDRITAEPTPVAVRIVEEEDGGAESLAPFVAVGAVLALAAVWWWRRR